MMLDQRDRDAYAHAVYRIRDKADEVIYIGVSIDPDNRIFNGHKFTADWADDYDHHDVTWYNNRDEAEAAEETAIKAARPVHNKQHNQALAKIKPVRITVDLSPADYEALNHWIGAAAARVTAAPGQRVTLSKAIRAMIRATTRDENVTLDVLGLLREDSERR